MATWKTFEDIDAWQKARVLTRDVYAVTSNGVAAKDFGLRDQIQRSAVSVMSNIAEGFGRGGNREFSQFLHVARASLAELKSQLYVMLDVNYMEQETFNSLYQQASQIEVRINGLIKHLRSSDIRGAKFEVREPEELEFAQP
ncbi:four helix bundle protein [Cerasicoccus frondis]|uniref:four helix bundle protein n=1 Tax=Cerasicoccus frondis TaxID=490090 RepID=UPI002852D589|nr:four helix bundle protein [Cerasicoccus frondis]